MEHPLSQLKKLTWKEARAEVHAVNPKLAKIIDAIDPGKRYWLAKVSYPYGSLVMKRALLMLPNAQGTLVPVTDPSLPSEIREGLSYNLLSNPVSLVLKNTFEIFVPLADRIIPLGGLLYPGTAFGAWRILNLEHTQQPAFIWDMTAGARSVFMLPKITEVKKHMLLKKKYGVASNVPLLLMDHWEVFRQLSKHSQFQQPWQAEILYFPKQWFEHLEDLSWIKFYTYFQNNSWVNAEFWRNQPLWSLIFSLILNDYPGRPNAYIMDTVKYLIHMGTGALPGFAAVQDDLAGPLSEIQRIYIEEYGLSSYPPVIMQPTLYNLGYEKSKPVYYSLQFPNAVEFKPSSRLRSSNILDLHEIRSLMMRCEQELQTNKFNVEGTALGEVFQKAKFDYFHNGVELHLGMKNSALMPQEDKSLVATISGNTYTKFPDMCSFVKGCVRVS